MRLTDKMEVKNKEIELALSIYSCILLLIYSASRFNLEGIKTLFGVLSPPKRPVAMGLPRD